MLQACSTNEVIPEKNINRIPVQASEILEKETDLSQRPKEDSKEFTLTQKGTKNWWLESLHEKRTLTEKTDWGPNK